MGQVEGVSKTEGREKELITQRTGGKNEERPSRNVLIGCHKCFYLHAWGFMDYM